MDAALLAEREAFKRRAMAVPTIENKKRNIDIGTAAKSGSGAKPPAGSSGDKGPSSSAAKFKGVSGSQYKFYVKSSNIVGQSLQSTEVTILAAQAPDAPT